MKIGDLIIWTYTPRRLKRKYLNIEDHQEYIRLRNIKAHGKGPFTIINIFPHPDHGDRIMFVEIKNKNGKKVNINALAFKCKK